MPPPTLRAAPGCPPRRRTPKRTNRAPGADRELACQRGLCDHRAGVIGRGEVLRSAPAARPAAALLSGNHKYSQARPGNDALVAHVAEVADQVAQKLDFDLVARREVAVASLRRRAEESARRHRIASLRPGRCRPRSAPCCRPLAFACVESEKLVGFQREDSIGAASRSFNKLTVLSLNAWRTDRRRITHGRLGVFTLPSITGPAMPKHAASMACLPARNSFRIASRPEYLCSERFVWLRR